MITLESEISSDLWMCYVCRVTKYSVFSLSHSLRFMYLNLSQRSQQQLNAST